MRLLGLFLFSFLLVSCGAPTPDIGSANGKQQILDEVNIDLTNGNCDDALTAISPLYNSAHSDNDVRLAMASVYGCKANINFFGLIGTLTSNISAFQTGLFSFLAKNFPSKAGSDYVVEGALYATDALQSALKPGALVLPVDQVNAGTFNVGSVLFQDRIDESNFYQLFISMAAIGGLENRFGSPNSTTFANTSSFSWTTAALMDQNGCAYASSLINLVDALTASESYLPSTVGSAIKTILTGGSGVDGLGDAMDLACSYGCKGGTPTAGDKTLMAVTGTSWTDSGCSSATVSPCSKCPAALRDRTQCKAANTNQVACAAAGLINFMNNSVAGWP